MRIGLFLSVDAVERFPDAGCLFAVELEEFGFEFFIFDFLHATEVIGFPFFVFFVFLRDFVYVEVAVDCFGVSVNQFREQSDSHLFDRCSFIDV